MIKMVEMIQCPPSLLINCIWLHPLLYQKPQLEERLLRDSSKCLICLWIKLKNEVRGLDSGWEPKCTVTIWAGAWVAVNEMFWGLMEWYKIWSSSFKCPTCCQTTTRLFLNGTTRSPHLTMYGWVIECDIVLVLWPTGTVSGKQQFDYPTWCNFLLGFFSVIPSPFTPNIRAHGPFEHIPGGFTFWHKRLCLIFIM